MKIAIPIADGKLCAHFGHCAHFAIVDVDDATKAIGATQLLEPPAHEPGVLPRWVHDQGATLVLAGGMGSRAQALFQQNGVDVLVGCPCDPPEALVAAYLSGSLVSGANACDH
jgi:ATP-binding protein involved in chromosome partitioning